MRAPAYRQWPNKVPYSCEGKKALNDTCHVKPKLTWLSQNG